MTNTLAQILRLPRLLGVLRAASAGRRRRLRLVEQIGLGDKRFAAILQVDDTQFLIAGSTGSVTLLSTLEEPDSFQMAMDERAQQVPGAMYPAPEAQC